MNTFLLGGHRLPLAVIMLGFMAGIVGLFLPAVNFFLPGTDQVLMVVVMAVSLLLLAVLYVYCQMRQVLDDYLDAEIYSAQLLCRESKVSGDWQPNPLSFVTGQIHRSSEQQLQQRINDMRRLRAEQRATIGEDTLYEGEEDYNSLAQEQEQERYHSDAPRY